MAPPCACFRMAFGRARAFGETTCWRGSSSPPRVPPRPRSWRTRSSRNSPPAVASCIDARSRSRGPWWRTPPSSARADMSVDRLRVFISSKMAELREERKLVKAALDDLRVDAWVFEQDAGARPDSIQHTYLAEVGDADLYLGIFWKGHGDRTIEEFEHARRLGKDCLIFEKRTELDGRTSALQDFLDRISDVDSGLTPHWFESAAELAEAVSRDVAAWQTRRIRKRAHEESFLA